ncbi:MAG: response regulator transcription factor [Acidimicrobiia bacterium]
MAAILLIEDDTDIRRLVADTLAGDGHQVETAATAMTGLKTVVDSHPDLVILDLGLPDLDGLELLQMIRAVSNVPVIAATARGADEDIIATLDAGADDYLVKPFSIDQLKARLRAVLRRVEGEEPLRVVEVGSLRVELDSRRVLNGDEVVELKPKEFDLLAYLAQRPDRVVPRRELLAEVWRMPFGGSDRTLDVHLSWLRKKLGESASEPRYIHTVHGVGVKLVEPG